MGNIDDGMAAIQRGAVVNGGLLAVWTPLCIAGCNGHLHFVEFLIEQGACIDRNEWHAMKVAIGAKQVDVVRYLVFHARELPEFHSRVQSFLMSSVSWGISDMIQIFVDHGAIINKEITYSPRLTPLSAASANGRADIVRCLLDSFNADANFANSDGVTASHLAALHGHTDVLEILMDHGADLNAINREQESVLDFAASCGRTIKWLVEHGVRVTGDLGVSVLRESVERNDLELVQILVISGADPLSEINRNGEDYRSAFDIAVKNPRSPVSELMLSMGVRPADGDAEYYPELAAWFRGEAGPQLERAAVQQALNAPDTRHLLPDIDAERLILDFICASESRKRGRDGE